jgi:hypothetical protein
MEYSDALEQSKQQLNPLFKDSMDTTLNNLGNDLKTRGMFGQMAGADQMMRAAGDNEGRRISALAQNANQLVANSQNASVNSQQTANSSADQALRERQYNDQLAQQRINVLGNLGNGLTQIGTDKLPWRKKQDLQVMGANTPNWM